jgi:hypothetical protein
MLRVLNLAANVHEFTEGVPVYDVLTYLIGA